MSFQIHDWKEFINSLDKSNVPFTVICLVYLVNIRFLNNIIVDDLFSIVQGDAK